MQVAQISAVDPVCGMSVNPTSALKRQHEGKSFYFCSEGCARNFDADPTKYVIGKRPPPVLLPNTRAVRVLTKLRRKNPPLTPSGSHR